MEYTGDFNLHVLKISKKCVHLPYTGQFPHVCIRTNQRRKSVRFSSVFAERNSFKYQDTIRQNNDY